MKSKAEILFCLLGLLAMFHSQAQPTSASQDFRAQHNSSFFVENQGQWPEMVLYKTSMGGMEAWITTKGIVYDFYQIEGAKKKTKAHSETVEVSITQQDAKDHRRKIGQVVKLSLQGASLPSSKPCGKQASYFNYFINNNPNKWASKVGLFTELTLENIYESIDLRYYFNAQGYLRYDYIVHPGASADQIRFSIEGADDYFINDEGELVFMTRFGEVKQKELELYQIIDGQRVIVEGKFTKTKDGIGFSVGDYDLSKSLVIDPLIYSTFIGGSLLDSVDEIAVDKEENAYIVAETYSYDFPSTAGAYDELFGNKTDCIISKFNNTGSELIFSTYIGGDDYYEQSAGICLDTSNNIYIIGATSSTNFPITEGAFDGTYGGGKDVFVLKLSSDGAHLDYSTFLGGATADSPGDITIDEDNNVYLIGQTTSTNFPTSTGAFDISWNGYSDIFVSKLNSEGDSLIFSTYVGGNYFDQGEGIALDADNNVYLTGQTLSDNFPTTTNAFDKDYNENTDVFFAKLNANGTELEYASYFGGPGTDYGSDIAIDADNNAYIVGYTRSDNFPVTSTAYDTLHNWTSEEPSYEIYIDSIPVGACIGGCVDDWIITIDTFSIIDDGFDVFVLKLNTQDTGLIYSTFIGGRDDDYGKSLALDAKNNVYITGYTESFDFPVGTFPYDHSYNSNEDVFLARLDSTGRFLDYSTFIGGSGNETGLNMVMDADEDIYITGKISSSVNFPTTSGAYDTIYSMDHSLDAFVLKMGGFVGSTIMVVNCPGDIAVDIPENQDSIQVFFGVPNITTNCAAGTNFTYSQIEGPPSGSNFGEGSQLITYEIVGECGDVELCSFYVTAEALGAVSMMDCPEDIEVTTEPGVDFYFISWDAPSAITSCGPSAPPVVTQTEGMSSNSNFSVGTHEITYTAVDDCGNEDNCTFNIIVNPGLVIGEMEVNCVEDIIVSAPAGSNTAEVSWTVTASTNCNVNTNVDITQIEGLFSNSDFPLGTNPVSFEISDNCNNIDTCSFNVIVNYTPVTGEMTVPCLEDIVLEAELGQNTHPVSWDLPMATTTCNVSSNIEWTQTLGLPPNSDFPIGTHEIEYTVKDDCDNEETCSFNVIIEGEPVSVLDLNNPWDFALNLYPNPATDFLHLEIQAQQSQEVFVRIYAPDGRLLNSSQKDLLTGENDYLVPISGLTNGVYIMEVTGNSIHKTKRFVKQN